MNLVYATDMGYLFPTQVSAASALAWATRRAEIILHIVDCGIEDATWERFVTDLRREFGDDFPIRRHIVDMGKYARYRSWHNSRGIYARIDLPSILPDIDWCLYVDGDTLFTDDPLKVAEIWSEKFAIMGHKDIYGPEQKEWHLEHGLPWNEDRFCAGFIAINLKWFRENGITDRCFELLAKYEFKYNEQDALNLLCSGKIWLFPDGWGCFVLASHENEIGRGCWHFIGERPWNFHRRRMAFSKYQKLWLSYAEIYTSRKPWAVLGISFCTFSLALCKEWVFMLLYRLLDALPGPKRGHYTKMLNYYRWTSCEFNGRHFFPSPDVSAKGDV